MPGLSIHVVDVTRGLPAAGMRVQVFAIDGPGRLLADGALASSGAFEHPISKAVLAPGTYEAVFHAGAFFAAAGVSQADPPFLGEVPFRFAIADSSQHYHLPLKITPWGFSIYRGS